MSKLDLQRKVKQLQGRLNRTLSDNKGLASAVSALESELQDKNIRIKALEITLDESALHDLCSRQRELLGLICSDLVMRSSIARGSGHDDNIPMSHSVWEQLAFYCKESGTYDGKIDADEILTTAIKTCGVSSWTVSDDGKVVGHVIDQLYIFTGIIIDPDGLENLSKQALKVEVECSGCDWKGPLEECVHPKHDDTMILCPECYETTDGVKSKEEGLISRLLAPFMQAIPMPGLHVSSPMPDIWVKVDYRDPMTWPNESALCLVAWSKSPFHDAPVIHQYDALVKFSNDMEHPQWVCQSGGEAGDWRVDDGNMPDYWCYAPLLTPVSDDNE